MYRIYESIRLVGAGVGVLHEVNKRAIHHPVSAGCWIVPGKIPVALVLGAGGIRRCQFYYLVILRFLRSLVAKQILSILL